MPTGELHWSDQHYRLWGLAPGSVDSAALADALHRWVRRAGNAGEWSESIGTLLRRGTGQAGSFHLEFGDPLELAAVTLQEFEHPEGRPLGVVGAEAGVVHNGLEVGAGGGLGVAALAAGLAKQVRVDQGLSPGTTTSDAARIKDLEREVKELKRANEILLAASSFFARELDRRLPW